MTLHTCIHLAGSPNPLFSVQIEKLGIVPESKAVFTRTRHVSNHLVDLALHMAVRISDCKFLLLFQTTSTVTTIATTRRE